MNVGTEIIGTYLGTILCLGIGAILLRDGIKKNKDQKQVKTGAIVMIVVGSLFLLGAARGIISIIALYLFGN
ncbi:MAG: hypothetical protein LBM97_02200 [Candidatus Nomurabacteria bacterium]|jgi:choline-glycine betaine transporter|nr:hypothetical protein [Candidatus Nomurabacteria bacterium]